MSENALKARYAAQMMAATAVLAQTAPDDFRRRCIGRISFVYCHEFIRYARRAKNELRRRGGEHRDRVSRLENLLDQLAVRDWGPYEVIRHRIAAHRQPFDSDPVRAITPANAAWNDIDNASLRILAEDARSIWNELAAAFVMSELTTFPPLSGELAAALRDHGYEPSKQGLAVGGGSFDATRPDAAFVIQGGDLGAIVRELVDAIRNVKLLSGLWQVINGHEPYMYVVLSAVHVEACTLYDLTFGQPPGTPAQHRRPSLLEHLEANDRSSPALEPLVAAERAMPLNALDASRTIRNRIGAHIDDRLPLNDLLDLLRRFDPELLNALLDHLFKTLTRSARVDVHLAGILMEDAVMAGLSLTEPPPDSKPYD